MALRLATRPNRTTRRPTLQARHRNRPKEQVWRFQLALLQELRPRVVKSETRWQRPSAGRQLQILQIFSSRPRGGRDSNSLRNILSKHNGDQYGYFRPWHQYLECPLFKCRPDRKPPAEMQTDANDRAPRGRELSVREGLTRINVDWSGSWQAARPGNWLGRSPATKAALGC